jgi:hypothetical protein
MIVKTGGDARPSGAVSLSRSRDLGDLQSSSGIKRAPLLWRIKNALERKRGASAVFGASIVGRLMHVSTFTSSLQAAVYRPDWASLSTEQALKLKVLLCARVELAQQQIDAMLSELGGYVDVRELSRSFGGDVTWFGCVSTRVVTTAGVGFIVDAFQNLVELENMKYHGFGTGTNAEASADTALQTEETTQYATDNTRPTGSLTEGASANIFRTVGTYSPDSGGTRAITEHGIFSQAATGGGTLLDRSVFSAVNLVAGADSLQTTYDLTCTAGG